MRRDNCLPEARQTRVCGGLSWCVLSRVFCLVLMVNVALSGSVIASTQRVVSVGGALTEIIYLLGAEQQLVAVDTTSLFPQAALKLPKVGYVRQLSSEGVLALRPTLVLATNEVGPLNALDQIRNAGVTIEITSAEHSFEDLRNKVKVVSKALGRTEAGRILEERLILDMADTARWVGMQPTQPRILFILSHSGTAQVSGEGTSADAMIRLAGGINAMSGFRGYKPLTAEAAVSANPDVIVTTSQGISAIGGVEKLLALPGLSLTTAGRVRRVVALEALYLLGFGPRLPSAVRELASKVRERPTPGMPTPNKVVSGLL